MSDQSPGRPDPNMPAAEKGFEPPEPEPEGFRQQLIEAEQERQQKVAEDQSRRNDEEARRLRGEGLEENRLSNSPPTPNTGQTLPADAKGNKAAQG